MQAVQWESCLFGPQNIAGKAWRSDLADQSHRSDTLTGLQDHISDIPGGLQCIPRVNLKIFWHVEHAESNADNGCKTAVEDSFRRTFKGLQGVDVVPGESADTWDANEGWSLHGGNIRLKIFSGGGNVTIT